MSQIIFKVILLLIFGVVTLQIGNMIFNNINPWLGIVFVVGVGLAGVFFAPKIFNLIKGK